MPYVRLTASHVPADYIHIPTAAAGRLLPVREVLAGPTRADERSPVVDTLQKLLKSRQYSIPATVSTIPYRF